MKKIIALALCGVFLLTACLVAETTESKDGSAANGSKKLVLSTFGLSEDVSWSRYLQTIWRWILLYNRNGTRYRCERFTKLSSNPDSSIDIIELSQAFPADGVAAGLFEEIDFSKMKIMTI